MAPKASGRITTFKSIEDSAFGQRALLHQSWKVAYDASNKLTSKRNASPRRVSLKKRQTQSRGLLVPWPCEVEVEQAAKLSNLLQISGQGTPNLEFFRPLGRPRRGDWLAEKKETGQTYTTYSRRMKPPMTPTKHTDTILLVPMGQSFSDGIAIRFLSYLVDYCAAFFSGMTIDVFKKPLSLARARKRMNDFNHDQYLIEDLFEALHTETRSHRKAYCRLGITMEDIYPGEEWNYVFGQAKPMERVGCLFALNL